MSKQEMLSLLPEIRGRLVVHPNVLKFQDVHTCKPPGILGRLYIRLNAPVHVDVS